MGGMKDLVSQAEFGNLIGVSRQRVYRMVQDGKLDGHGPDNHVDINSPAARDLVARSERTKSDKAEQRAERRAELEVKKLEQQGLNLDLKNRQMRGKLRDAQLQDAAFVELLQAAADRFRAAGPAVLDEIIAAAMKEGFDSRAQSELKFLNEIDAAADDILRQWGTLIRSWETTAQIMSTQDSLD